MDGLTGAVIVARNEKVEGFELIHPEDITTGRADIRTGDVLINVPYHPNCSLWFDHHQHTATYKKPPERFKGASRTAPSAASLVYEYYGGKAAMPELAELVRETDRMDSADLRPKDVSDPQGYLLMGFTIDGRTGFGAFRTYFTILFELLKRELNIDDVLNHPVVSRRVDQMRSNQAAFQEVLRLHSRLQGNVVITDFRPLARVPVGNRFLIYTLYPSANVSVRVHWGPSRQWVVASLGHNIFKRTCRTDLGAIATRYGGGGHRGSAGASLKPLAEVDALLAEIIAELEGR